MSLVKVGTAFGAGACAAGLAPPNTAATTTAIATAAPPLMIQAGKVRAIALLLEISNEPRRSPSTAA
jgi:hypothetical protein